VTVEGFAPIWDRLFPKGRLFPGDNKYLEKDIPQTLVRYPNFPGLRTSSLAYSLRETIARRLRAGVRPLAILTYNPYPHYCRALNDIARKYPGIPWVNIVLDLDDPTPDCWKCFSHETREAAAAVFLSWWGFCNAPVERKLHLDGGWEGEFPDFQVSRENVFVYAGSMWKYAGFEAVVDAIRLLPDKNVRFDFFGNGVHEDLQKLAAVDSRVCIRGFIPEAELKLECRKAMGFLCPRDLDHHGTKMIFPSKLLFYLMFQKPVITPQLPGLSPDYNAVLISPSASSPVGWRDAMKHVLALGAEERAMLGERIKAFMLTKSWNVQAARLITFLHEVRTSGDH
jgi:glycosyltransferase involved in cell wall biosynthesis